MCACPRRSRYCSGLHFFTTEATENTEELTTDWRRDQGVRCKRPFSVASVTSVVKFLVF
jgi:hypothetical protein